MVQEDAWAWFGDGTTAQIVDYKSYIKTKNNIKYYKFIFIPTAMIEQEFDLIEDQDPSTGMVVREYEHTHVVFLHQNPHRTRILITCDFNGNDTPLSRRTHELEETLLDTERLLGGERAAKNRLHEELRIEREQQRMAIQSEVNKLLEFAKVRGKGGEEEETGYSQAGTEPGSG